MTFRRTGRTSLVIAFCLITAGAATAWGQDWAGSATLGIQAKGANGALEGALVTIEIREPGLAGGPPPRTTTSRGEANFVGLAPGTWSIEISHPDYLTYVGTVRVGDKKPIVVSEFLQATGQGRLTTRVKYLKGLRDPRGTVAQRPAAAAPTREPARTRSPEEEAERTDAEATAATRPVTPDTPASVSEPQPAAPTPPTTAATESREEPPPPAAGELPESAAAPPTEVSATGEAPAPEPESAVAQPPAEAPPATEAEAPEAEPTTAAAESREAPPVVEDPRPEIPATAPETGEGPVAQPEPTVQPPTDAPPATEPEVVDSPRAEPAPPTPAAVEIDEESPAAVDETEMPGADLPQPIPEAEDDTPPVPEPPQASLAPDRSALRSYGDRSCVECKPGEWAVSAAADLPARGDSGCPANAADEARLMIERAIAAAGDTLASYSGPLPADLAPFEIAPACRVIAVVLPRSARFAGFRFEAAGPQGRGQCLGDGSCEAGAASWLFNPEIAAGRSATVIYSVFENQAADESRVGILTAYFLPRGSWPPAP